MITEVGMQTGSQINRETETGKIEIETDSVLGWESQQLTEALGSRKVK